MSDCCLAIEVHIAHIDLIDHELRSLDWLHCVSVLPSSTPSAASTGRRSTSCTRSERDLGSARLHQSAGCPTHATGQLTTQPRHSLPTNQPTRQLLTDSQPLRGFCVLCPTLALQEEEEEERAAKLEQSVASQTERTGLPS